MWVLPGGRGWDYVWKCAGLSFEQLQALFDRTNPDGSPWWKWLYTAFYTPLWMLSDVTIKDGVWFHFLNFTPSEQIAFLIGLQQMIRENAEYGGFTVGEVPVSGIDPVMHALARLKYFLDQVEARAQADPIFAANLGLQKGASELDAGDLVSLAGGIFGLSKLGKEVFSQDEGGGGGRGGKDDDSGKGADGVIKPSLPPDPNRKPEGEATEIPPKASDGTARDLKTENKTALILAQNGWRVEQNPDSSKLPRHIQESDKHPDYIVEGIVMDCYSPSKEKPLNGIWQEIGKKVNGAQADGVVLNLDNRSDADEVIKYLTSGEMGIPGLRTIIVVKDGKTRVSYP